MASAALICACVPLSVSVLLPLAPALMLAPPARLRFKVPLFTLKRVVARLPSTSFTLRPLMARLVFSLTVCAPDTVWTGASLTLLTVMATFW